MLFINDLIYIFPEIFFGFSIIVLLCFSIFNYKAVDLQNGYNNYWNITLLLIKFTYLIVIIMFFLYGLQFFTLYYNSDFFYTDIVFYTFNETLIISMSSILFKCLILFIFLLYLIFVQFFYEIEQIYKFEFIILLLLAVFGLLFFITANNFLIMYLALELQTISLYILCCFKYKKNSIVESGLKLFVSGAFISGLLIFGISLVYGALGTLNFNDIQLLLNGNDCSIILLCGFWFIIVSFLFKLAIAPFHLWLSDVYEGSLTLVICFFAIIPKIAAAFVFFRLFYEIFFFINFYILDFVNLLTFLGIFSILIGSLGAIMQKKLKSFIAYSSISNIGYFVLLITLFDLNKNFILYLLFLFFLFYSITLLIIFTIILSLNYWNNNNRTNNIIYLYELTGLSKINLGFAIALSFSLFSLMGIPPFIGFFIKYLLVSGLISLNLYYLVLLLLLLGILSAFYYLRLVKLLFFDKSNLILFLKPISFNTYLYLYGLIFILLFIFLKSVIFFFFFNLIL